MPIALPELPLHEAGWIFALLFALILFVPMLAERLRVPPIVGLVLAGTLVGPTVLGLLELDGPIRLLGTAGLLYLMFVAGLELDLGEFQKHRRDAAVFGGLTFAVPMVLSTAAVAAMGYDLLAAVLIASCWASHTLLTYPVFRRAGTHANRAVATSVGATIITDTAALLVLVVVVRGHEGDLGLSFWATLLPSLAVLVGLLVVVLPRVARWFFAGPGQDGSMRFTFTMVALFAAAGLAELAGVEAIIGAFLAGLALNRLVPNGSVLMERVEFLGSSLLIPLFLISVGMLVDPAVLADPSTLAVSAAFIVMALGAKALAALAAGRLLGYGGDEVGAMFALSGAQAAATLAAIIIGLQAGLIDEDTVNAVILVILVTCLVTSWAAGRYAPRLAHPSRPQPLGDAVVVPVARPGSRGPLVRLAAAMASRDSGFVIPLTVVPPEVRADQLGTLRAAREDAEREVLSHGAEAEGIIRIDRTPAAGILHTLVERTGSLLVLGWDGHTAGRHTIFGTIIDRVLGESPVPILISRLSDARRTGILLTTSDVNATPAGLSGFHLALQVASRLSAQEGLPVRVISSASDPVIERTVAAVLGVEVVHDPRKRAIAVHEHARPGDVVIAPVKPEPQSLRGVATRIARSVADVDLIIALDTSSPRDLTRTIAAATGASEDEIDLPASARAVADRS
jgi:Kef-type K+ transport system membrane component KefB